MELEMHSSISSSELRLSRSSRETIPGLRLTAADRPGVAQPVPERDIPNLPWKQMLLMVAILTSLLTAVWEWQMRRQGLTPGDLGLSKSAWIEQRRRIDAEPVPVAIVGDSRILFDTDLDRFQQLTGLRPVQLALPGTNGRPFLEDLAADPNFTGVVIVGMADLSYFRERVGLMASVLDRGHWESPGDRASFEVHRALQERLAMLQDDYRLSKLVVRLDRGVRPKVEGPYEDVWKVGESYGDRQTWLWHRLEHDEYLRNHAIHAWQLFEGKPVEESVIQLTQRLTSAAVNKIRARGGEVVFIRPPSSGECRVNEDKRLPRSKGWDALLSTAKAVGVHADDLPAAQALDIPECSHLAHACATVFTDAYVRRLSQLTPRLSLRADAPAALSSADCVAR
jgi:hypothetical protein